MSQNSDLPKIILDCDPGHDDAVALLLAGRHTEILGITTVSGNAPLSYTTANALLLAELAELDVQVYAGADKPLEVEPAHAGHVHGDTGLDGPTRPAITRQPQAQGAVDFIIETVRATDDVWLVPIGPLTNIALALQQAPDIVTRIAGLSLMGGSTAEGNVTAVSEFNFWADPHAAAQVMASGIAPLRMAGLNLTHQFRFDKATVEQLRRGPGPDDAEPNGAEPDDARPNGERPVNTFVADLFEFYLATCKLHTGADDAPLHDPCAVLAITHPQLFEYAHGHVSVATNDALTRGMSVWDQRPMPDQPPNCEIATLIDHAAGMRIVIDAINSY